MTTDYPTKAELDAQGVTLEPLYIRPWLDLHAWAAKAKAPTPRTLPEGSGPKRIVAWPRRSTGKRIA